MYQECLYLLVYPHMEARWIPTNLIWFHRLAFYLSNMEIIDFWLKQEMSCVHASSAILVSVKMRDFYYLCFYTVYLYIS